MKNLLPTFTFYLAGYMFFFSLFSWKLHIIIYHIFNGQSFFNLGYSLYDLNFKKFYFLNAKQKISHLLEQFEGNVKQFALLLSANQNGFSREEHHWSTNKDYYNDKIMIVSLGFCHKTVCVNLIKISRCKIPTMKITRCEEKGLNWWKTNRTMPGIAF